MAHRLIHLPVHDVTGAIHPGGPFCVLRAALLGLLLWSVTLTAACGAALPDPNQPLRLDETSVGNLDAGATAEFHAPANPDGRRLSAVILMHGCSGVTAAARRWAQWLNEWGHAALILDSFRPRGFTNICGRGQQFPPVLRAADGFAAAAWLRGRSDIDPDRIALIGFSHGGATALAIATRAMVTRLAVPPLRAVVAFYPWCPRQGMALASDLLILIGGADDWTPAERCQALAEGWDPGLGTLELAVYPGATHAFDAPGQERVYFGHHIRPDPDATADAARRVRAFLAVRLDPAP